MTPKGFARMIAHRYKKNTSYRFILQQLSKAIQKYELLHFDESKKIVAKEREVCLNFLEMLK